MRRGNTARTLAVGIAILTVLGTIPLVMAADNFENSTVTITVEDNDYPTNITNNPKWFFPGDPINLTIEVTGFADGLEDMFDIIVFRQGDTMFADNVGMFNNIVVDPIAGTATVVYSGTKSVALPDGLYDVYVGDETWIEDDGFDSGRGPFNSTWFRIQMYVVKAETDREAYVPGDEVTVSYSVQSIKDGALITEARYPGWGQVQGVWAVWSEDGDTSEGPTSVLEPSGSFSFQIFPVGHEYPWEYHICLWYNGTYGTDRENLRYLGGNTLEYDFRVDGLNLTVQTDKTVYQIGSDASVDVHTGVNGTATSVPDTDVQIQILRGTIPTATVITGYGGAFISNANGQVHYEFTVSNPDFVDGETYTVRVNATKHMQWENKDVTFDVSGILDTDDDGIPDSEDPDDDDDGYPDDMEEQEGSDPKDPASKPLDNDEDYIPDSTDDDDDNDGYSDDIEEQEGSDPMDETSKPADNDEDFDPDSTDDDDDNDGYSDDMEEQEGSDPKDATSRPPDNDEDFDPDSTDDDDDNDGYSDADELEAGSDPFDAGSVPQDVEAGDTWLWLLLIVAVVVILVVVLTFLVLRKGRMTGEPLEEQETELDEAEDADDE
jgi:hypothetical protein